MDFNHAHENKARIAKNISESFSAPKREETPELQKSEQQTLTPHQHQELIKSQISSSFETQVSEEEFEVSKSEEDDLEKSEEDELEKGGKRAVIGERRTFGGREYIKTSSGWKFHGKGTGAKAQEHAKNSSSESSKKSSEEKVESESLSDEEFKKRKQILLDRMDRMKTGGPGFKKLNEQLKQLNDSHKKATSAKRAHEVDHKIDPVERAFFNNFAAASKDIRQEVAEKYFGDKNKDLSKVEPHHYDQLSDMLHDAIKRSERSEKFKRGEAQRLHALIDTDPHKAYKEAKKYSELYGEELKKNPKAERFGESLASIKAEYDTVMKEAKEAAKPNSSKKESAKEGEIRTFGGREYIKKDGKWKYHPKGASKSTEESASKDKINKEFDALVAKTSDSAQKKKLEEKRKEALETSAKSYQDTKPTSGKHIGDMSATEKKALATKLGISTEGKTTKQVDKAITDAMVEKQLADWKASKGEGKPKKTAKPAVKKEESKKTTEPKKSVGDKYSDILKTIEAKHGGRINFPITMFDEPKRIRDKEADSWGHDKAKLTWKIGGDQYSFDYEETEDRDSSRHDEDGRPYVVYSYTLNENGKKVDSGTYSTGGYTEDTEEAGQAFFNFLRSKVKK